MLAAPVFKRRRSHQLETVPARNAIPVSAKGKRKRLMVIFKDALDLEHRLSLTNLATGSSNAAVVVWRGNPRPEGWEYGIELIAPEMDFWGLEL